MTTINFQPKLRQIREILKSDYYTIPRFQRPYSWNTENLDDFWTDVLRDNDEGYFIGPMVSYSVGKGTYGIVDGQQRMTTLTLAICALRDLFISLEEERFAEGIAQYIERKDDDSNIHYVLTSESSDKFLRTQFQARPEQRMFMEASDDEQRALRRAYDDINKWLTREVSGESTDIPEGADESPAVKHLKEIRDRILSLQVIWIQLDNDDDAYVVFETLNSRGKDLETVDLLKNLLLGAIRQENGDLDTARLRWNNMREVLSSAGPNANANKYLLHWWLARHEYTAERKLYRLMKRKIDKSTALTTLVDLERTASTYIKIVNPKAWNCLDFERPARTSLESFSIFSVSQPRPFLLALLKSYEENEIRYKSLSRALNAIECYHYITTAVVGVSSTGGVSQMYASHARELTNAPSQSQRAAAIDGLIAKLRDKMPSREQFIAAFPENLRFSEDEPSQKRLVQYTLRRLYDTAKPHVGIDHAKFNIEHIEVQSGGNSWAAGIGNLLWIDAKLNHTLGSLPFAKKREIYAKNSQMLDVEDIIQLETWGEKEAKARAVRLAEFGYDVAWKF
jgi:hypothetical protein